LPLAADQRALQHDALGHGDRLQGVPRGGAALARAARGPVRDRAGDHRQGLQAQAADLRIAHLVLRAVVRRGQEDHLARRVPRGVGAAPGAARGLTAAVLIGLATGAAFLAAASLRLPSLVSTLLAAYLGFVLATVGPVLVLSPSRWVTRTGLLAAE